MQHHFCTMGDTETQEGYLLSDKPNRKSLSSDPQDITPLGFCLALHIQACMSVLAIMLAKQNAIEGEER